MITYKYKLYRTHRTKYLDKMLDEACFVWNHALALQKRYYRLYGKYISINKMKKHFAKRIRRNLIGSQTEQEILERLDSSYQRFFKHKSSRPPKFCKPKRFSSFVLKQKVGYRLNGNVFTLNKINKNFKFSLSRQYYGKIKSVIIKKNKIGEFFIHIVTDSEPTKYRKTHDGASVGIDFGLKKYLVLSNGLKYNNPRFLKRDIGSIKVLDRRVSKCQKLSKNKARKRIELNRLYVDIHNKRNDCQWKLAHELCKSYDYIFVEDLALSSMMKNWGKKLMDFSHADFIIKLEYVATKYGVVVHKIDRYYPSSKSCTCGYVNKELKLSDRQWKCPMCGAIHDRDLLAANNILRRGIYELESSSKTSKRLAKKHLHYNPTISQ